MWFNKTSLFLAFWSGSTISQGEDNRRGLITITFTLTRSVLLSHSEKEVSLQCHSHQLWTECLILVVVKTSAARLLFTLQGLCEMTHGRREEAASLVDRYRDLFHRNWLRSVVTLRVDTAGFQSSGEGPTGLCAHGFVHQLSSFCFIHLSEVFDLMWSSVILPNMIR